MADELSRMRDVDDWELREETMELIHDNLGDWQVDRFAERSNTKCPVFNSLFPSPYPTHWASPHPPGGIQGGRNYRGATMGRPGVVAPTPAVGDKEAETGDGP
jgi:hypothetical protein